MKITIITKLNMYSLY